MSPRATMIPSAVARISSKLSKPSWFSILQMILISLPPFASRKLRISKTSSLVRVNEAAMKSTPRFMPNNKSPLSFSDRNGIEMWVFGRFTPLCSPSSPLFCTSQTTSPPLISITFKPIKPSSNKTVAPTFKSFAKLG